jgi:hypothetical protein
MNTGASTASPSAKDSRSNSSGGSRSPVSKLSEAGRAIGADPREVVGIVAVPEVGVEPREHGVADVAALDGCGGYALEVVAAAVQQQAAVDVVVGDPRPVQQRLVRPEEAVVPARDRERRGGDVVDLRDRRPFAVVGQQRLAGLAGPERRPGEFEELRREGAVLPAGDEQRPGPAGLEDAVRRVRVPEVVPGPAGDQRVDAVVDGGGVELDAGAVGEAVHRYPGILRTVGPDVRPAGEPGEQRLRVGDLVRTVHVHPSAGFAEPARVVREDDVTVAGVEPRQWLTVGPGPAPAVRRQDRRALAVRVRLVQRGDDGRPVLGLDLERVGDRDGELALRSALVLDRREYRADPGEQRRTGRADSTQQ